MISRASSFAFKGRTVDAKQIAADLGLRYPVQGSVRRAGPRARIAAQLVEATTAQQVWGKTFDRELADVFAVQDELREAIAASVVGDLHRVEHASAQRRGRRRRHCVERVGARPMVVTSFLGRVSR